MRIGQIDLPAPVLNAQEAGKLVVFAGAGVSIPSPSNYPNFIELAKWVGRTSGAAPDWNPEATHEPIDVFLGRLYSQRINIHEMVKTQLSDPNSRPTELHHSLLSLFRSEREVRIVTTNFDTHLSTAAGSVFKQPVPAFVASALPAARRSQGIVYLHGGVAQDDPADLVLTDVDFGRAYLTEGWATRFLIDLFSTYTVLFVGFSHSDPILRYLGRGLPPRTSRYALTEQGRNEHWALLGVIPVEYPLVAGPNTHGALTVSVRAWAQLTTMDALDKEQRLRLIVQRPPGVDPEETDFVRLSLADLATARFFARHASGTEWLDWLDRQGVLDQFFDQAKDPAELEWLLAQWIAAQFLVDGDHALGLLQRKGKRLAHTLWWAVTRALVSATDLPPPRTLAGWTAVLLDAPANENNGDILARLVRRCRIPEDEDTVVLLIEELVRPTLVLRPSYGFGGTGDVREYDVEVVLRAREDGVAEVWKALRPRVGALAHTLARPAAASIGRAHRLLRSAGKTNDQWDSISVRRAAIASHKQNSRRREMNPVIDIARDAVEELLRSDPTAARRLRDEWHSEGSAVLRRLAVHALAEDTNTSADEKMRHILRNGWLFSLPLKPEVFRLLKTAYSAAQIGVRRRLLGRARKGPPGMGRTSEGRRTRDYEIYNLLGWLAQAAPNCTDTRSPLTSSVPSTQTLRRESIPTWTGTWAWAEEVGG